jgi:hypothetical protein
MEFIPVQQRDYVSTYRSLRSLFEKNITVNSISEVLASCHISDQAQEIRDQMVSKDYDVIGVEENGRIIGYVLREELKEGTCKDYLRTFSPFELVSDSTPLLQTLFIFKDTDRLFIIEGNRITKVVTLADLQKPPIRMLLFGVISVLEMHLYRIISEYFVEDSWKRHLSDKRIQLAEELFLQRKARNEAIKLSDCLQLCDKRDIVLNEQPLREILGIESKSKGKDFFKKLEVLRNNLAHSQDLNTQNSWTEMISLIEQTENILEQCERI